ncbi:hypothetical protein A0H76_503 [Hepatospora eriocheir]|uniref:dUTPase-like domain-containing protein n=1 Tax=Hepatospora eriocheir TaxID=1081669 RepID=A0A1X0QL27_9MICR|nr:hypothetical protein HERIO_307 [Hepatospora eriocheir]ORE00491.1 hypothetical protein A0H76_503 [Hepatospora eriocheir]
MSEIIKYFKLYKKIKKPKYTPLGYEIYSPVNLKLKAGEPYLVPLGFKMSFPKTYCCLLTKNKCRVLGGLIDSDCRGEIRAILCPKEDIFIKRNTIIVVMQILEIDLPVIKENKSNSFIQVGSEVFKINK